MTYYGDKAKVPAAQEAVLDALTKTLTAEEVGVDRSMVVRNLAEAFAWLVSPGQPHGGAAGPAQ